MQKEKEIHYGTGRRKTSVAKVWLYDGGGHIVVNGKKMTDVFPRILHQKQIMEPLEVSNMAGKVDVRVTSLGGGDTGQAGAIRLGIARALVAREEEYRKNLRSHGCLTRDPRMKERKKYGRKRARKRFQFSKR